LQSEARPGAFYSNLAPEEFAKQDVAAFNADTKREIADGRRCRRRWDFLKLLKGMGFGPSLKKFGQLS
jgi:hypothetical protein